MGNGFGTPLYYFRHWVNSVSDIYGPDEIEELLEDLNRLEMASFDGIMMFDNDPVPPDHHDLSMRPTSSEMNIMRDGEAVISGCITQLPDDDLEDFDIDGSHVSIPMQQNNMNKGACTNHVAIFSRILTPPPPFIDKHVHFQDPP